jgi:hypothetical protein
MPSGYGPLELATKATTAAPDNLFVEELTTFSTQKLSRQSHLINAYYTGSVSSWLKIQFDFDYYTGDSETNLNSVSKRAVEERVVTQSLQDYDIYAGKLSLSTPLWGNMRATATF